jgi:hypothetical protein
VVFQDPLFLHCSTHYIYPGTSQQQPSLKLDNTT